MEHDDDIARLKTELEQLIKKGTTRRLNSRDMLWGLGGTSRNHDGITNRRYRNHVVYLFRRAMAEIR